MTFTVLWTKEASQSLLEIIARTSHPERIINAIREIDRELSDEPQAKGESRSAGSRIIFAPPLAASFTVQWRLSQALVGKLWAFELHDKP